jgi:murein tripeptide amidase MpaA
MTKGIIDFLSGQSVEAQTLRDHFEFKIVPMLNPDGVINGNYRCSLAGVDLNRKWDSPVQRLYPTIHHLKKLLTTLQTQNGVAVYCDFHGHSKHPNVFM